MSHELAELLEGMASPDPLVRDGWAYTELAEGIASGRFATDWDCVRDHAVNSLYSRAVQARTFAPLMLRWLTLAGDRDRVAFDAVAAWYLSEQDTRGYDDDLGWLHAVAHGADYLGTCASARVVHPARVLDLLAKRTTSPGGAWVDQENARVACAALQALAAAHVDGRDGVAALVVPITAALDSFEEATQQPDPRTHPPTWLSNLYSTLTTLYVAVSEHPLPDSAVDIRGWAPRLRHEVASLTSRMTPWLFTPTRPSEE